MLIQNNGRPCMKLVVPSIGSMIQINSLSSLAMVASSVIKPALGINLISSATKCSSAALSTYVTKSFRPFDSTSYSVSFFCSARMNAPTRRLIRQTSAQISLIAESTRNLKLKLENSFRNSDLQITVL